MRAAAPAGSRFVQIGVAISLGLFAVQSLAGLVASLGFHAYGSLVDLDRNNGLPDLLSTCVILAAALAAATLAAQASASRWPAIPLAFVLSAVAVDDLIQAEPKSSSVSGVSVLVTLTIAAVLIVIVAQQAPLAARIAIFTGLCLLVTAVPAAFAWDQLLNAVGRPWLGRGDVEYELGIVVKQGLELMGWSLVAVGVWSTSLTVHAAPKPTVAATAAG